VNDFLKKLRILAISANIVIELVTWRQCFDLHPSFHCGKTNHLSEKCRKRKKIKKTIHYGRINSWRWNQQVNKLYKSNHLAETDVEPQLHGEMTKEKSFQMTILYDFGHDLGPILCVL
jgi:hypothetical protein